MAVERCADCGSLECGEVNQKECPYCERYLCPSCADKQVNVFSWNGCAKCCIDYRSLVYQNGGASLS